MVEVAHECGNVRLEPSLADVVRQFSCGSATWNNECVHLYLDMQMRRDLAKTVF
jgi:hypothetical protein